MEAEVDYEALAALAEARGLRARGGFRVEPADEVPDVAPGTPARTLVLLGNVGSSVWGEFSASGFLDGRPDPLDAWSREVVGTLAAGLGARAIYPFGGPPFHPFLRWAEKAEPVWPSVMGPLIDARYGLWHAYRGALAFPYAMSLAVRAGPTPAEPPCAACRHRPCVTTCPVDALEEGRYDVPRCVEYLVENPDSDCMREGCRARRACPVGREFTYRPAQARHHMEAFVRTHRPPAGRDVFEQ